MVENPKEPRFRIGREDRPETILEAEEKTPEIQKVSHRVTRVTVLILLLLAAVFGVSYFQLKKRFNQVHDEGTQGLSAVSRNIENRFLSLLEEQEKMKDELENKIRSLEKRAGDLKTSIQQAEKQVLDLGASKTDKKEMENTLSKFDEALKAFQKELSGLSGTLPRMEKKWTTEMTQIAEALGKLKTEITRAQEEVGALSLKKADKAILDVKFKSEQKAFRRMLDQAVQELEARVQTLQRRLDLFEKSRAPAQSNPPPRVQKPEASPAPESGKIQEETIKE